MRCDYCGQEINGWDDYVIEIEHEGLEPIIEYYHLKSPEGIYYVSEPDHFIHSCYARHKLNIDLDENISITKTDKSIKIEKGKDLK